MNIVPTTVSYTYSLLQENVKAFLSCYPFLQSGTIGSSVLGKSIPYFRLGIGPKEVFYNASFHANEWITSVVLMKFVENFCDAYASNSSIHGYSIRELFKTTSIYIVPMVNTDGVDLVTGGLKDPSAYSFAHSLASDYPDIPFPDGWKANIEGVDLNLQFPAGWEQAKRIKYSQGFTSPAPRDYVGYCALSAPEAQAIYSFTLNHDFKLILAYHSQGSVIYWKFQDYLPPNSAFIANQFSKASGYVAEETPFNSGFAGYKDWFIQTFNQPGYTVEVGLGESPLPISQFNMIYRDNEPILLLGAVLA